MFEPTGSRRDAASVIFNLPGYRVVEAVDLPLRGRRVKVQPVDLDDGCPGCGVVSSRVHAWVEQRVRDIPHAGQVVVVVRKPRLICVEPACGRRTFTPATEQLPARVRCTTRLKTALLDAVINSGRAVWEVAADLRVAWWTVQATVNAAAVLLPEVDNLHVRRLGIDEHRYRRVRWFRDDQGGWRRVEPWMSTIVNADCGQVLGPAQSPKAGAANRSSSVTKPRSTTTTTGSSSTTTSNPATNRRAPVEAGGRARQERHRAEPRTVAADRGYGEQAVEDALHDLGVKQVVIPRKGRPGKTRQAHQRRRTFRRHLKWRTGCEGRISTLKRGYGWDRTMIDTTEGARIWTGHGILAHNLVKISALAG